MVQDEFKKALTHILENVFQLESGSPLVLAINQDGFQDIVDLHCMQFKHINEMQYKDADGIEVPLQGLHAYPLRIFKHYMSPALFMILRNHFVPSVKHLLSRNMMISEWVPSTLR